MNIDKLRDSRITFQHLTNVNQVLGISFGSFFRIGNLVYQRPKKPMDGVKNFWCISTGELVEFSNVLIHVHPVDIFITEYAYDYKQSD